MTGSQLPHAWGVEATAGLIVTAAGVEAFECPVCQQPRDLVVPECGDAHEQCPDRACAVCGFALVFGGTSSRPELRGNARGSAA